MIRKFIAIALTTALMCVSAVGGAAPAQPEKAAVGADQLLLLAVQLDSENLTESLTAYGDPDDPLIPLGELGRLLDLPLDVRPGEGLVTGRLGENQRALTIDLKAGKAILGGRIIALVPPDRKVTGADIYLRASLVEKLLPLRIAVHADEMLLVLTATERLPLQARRDRAARLRGLMDAPEVRDEVLKVATPYGWLTRPAFDIGLELGADSERGRAVTRGEARIAADIARTGFTGWLTTDESGKPSSARLTAALRSAEGNLLGPLRATFVAAGDVYSPALPVGARSSGGAGVALSSARLEDTSVFQRINLRGELPIGYDVELYVNDILRSARQGATVQGRYEFNDVPLVRGRNVIRIVLYGPRGERSEQTRIVNLGGGQLAPGQTTFDAGMIFQDRAVVPLSNDDQLLGNRARGSLRAVIGAAHGITPGLTASAGFASYEDYSGNRHDVLTGGLRTSLLGMAVQADLGKELGGGSALSLGTAGSLGGVSFLARHVEYSGRFNDEANSAWDSARPMRRYDEVTMDFMLPLSGKARLPVAARLERAQYADGGTSFSARTRTTASLGGTLVGMGFDYWRRTGRGGRQQQLVGDLSASRFIAYKWQLRAVAEYKLKPKVSFDTLAVTADRAIGDRYSLRLGAGRNFAFKDNMLQAGLTAHLRFADATLGGDWSTRENRWRVGLQLNFGLGYNPARRGYRLGGPGPANGGSALVQAFVDDNANGVPDAGEAPVSGVEIQGGARKILTDARGEAYLTNLGEGGAASLRADISNADTPGFVSAPPQTIMFAPRAGNVARVLYPLVPTSELVVRLKFRQQDGMMTGLSAVRLRLVPASGPAIEGATEFDGTAVFDAVKPGTWRVELEGEQAARLGLSLAAPLSVTIGRDGRTATIDGEVLLERKAAP